MQPFRQQETDRLSAGGFLCPSLVKKPKSIILFAKQ